MGRTLTVEAIILKAHDVGEADRFCILFTKERGKLTARARSVRKPGSRMGGTLLPMQHCSMELREGSAGFSISDAKRLSNDDTTHVDGFLQKQQGIELLLHALHDEEPLPELFETTILFLHQCDTRSFNSVLPFTIRLLHLLGLLPAPDEPFFALCTDVQKDLLRECTYRMPTELPDLSSREKEQFSLLCAQLLSNISSAPLKAGSIVSSMRKA